MVHGQSITAHEADHMPYSISALSVTGRFSREQALLNMDQLSLPYYQIIRNNPESGKYNIYGVKAYYSVLKHFNETG